MPRLRLNLLIIRLLVTEDGCQGLTEIDGNDGKSLKIAEFDGKSAKNADFDGKWPNFRPKKYRKQTK